VRRGEVWWVEHPASGRRPYLIMTREAVIPVLRKVVAVPATRRIRGIPSAPILSEDDGMPDQCALSFDNLTVLSKGLFIEPICRLGPVRMAQACRALAVALGC
jgi:mRNA interferase MazF